jgi:iron complex outermembrane receptor protein
VGVGAILIQIMNPDLTETSPSASTRPATRPILGMPFVTLVALLGGFVSLSYEIFLFRTVSLATGSSSLAFALTLAGRYNLALIRLIDRRGTALNGNNRFSRFNPSAGATYKITPEVTGYFGYSEANRTPTSGEIACSDPMRPCSLDNFLSADPPGLKQVVAYAYEAGIRGRFNVGTSEPAGKIEWNFGLFRNDLNDDILNVPAANISTGFFRNIGSTRRQGIEANIGYRDEDWRLSADYGLIDATVQNAITLSSPNSPSADANGDIQVKPGNRLPGIPQQRLKINAEYAVTGKWTLGGNLVVASGQYFFLSAMTRPV